MRGVVSYTITQERRMMMLLRCDVGVVLCGMVAVVTWSPAPSITPWISSSPELRLESSVNQIAVDTVRRSTRPVGGP
ncbi:hypothetical protein E4U26_008314 [Claviceps purpurea]|nr:hypothetical protein E4U37_000142 [Claviceps purpurea]KAG6215962.1 hypothetical protein E4U26_008314 [Claviceps purpurea]